MTNFVPKRVASLQPSATSTLDSLGLVDRVVACTRHCAAVSPHLDTAAVSIIEDSWTAQAEQIVAAQPDMVIASVPYQTEAIAQILAAGIRVLALAPRTLADVYGDIATIANLMGMAGRGEELIGYIREEVDAVRARAAQANRRTVFCEEWGKPIMVSQPWVAELVEAAGGTFLGTPGGTALAKGIRTDDPDVVVFAWCGAGDRVPMEKLVFEREWQGMRAVETGAVFAIRDEFLTTPGPPLVTGLLAVAHAIHPEMFPAPLDFSGTKVMRRLGEPVVK
jgi:iron complex transport system substrate-binding protein